MKNRLFRLSIVGFVFTSVIGTLSHFVFEWSKMNTVAGLFCPVNESSWEHLKLLFFPYFIWTVIQYALTKEKIFFPKAVGAAAGTSAILIFFYTYSGIIGKNVGILNILSFFIGVACAFCTDYFMIKSGRFASVSYNAAGILLLLFYGGLFFLFTFYPPLIPLFKDPVSLTYGI